MYPGKPKIYHRRIKRGRGSQPRLDFPGYWYCNGKICITKPWYGFCNGKSKLDPTPTSKKFLCMIYYVKMGYGKSTITLNRHVFMISATKIVFNGMKSNRLKCLHQHILLKRGGGRTGQVVRALDSGSGDPGSILSRVGVLFP